MLLATRAAAFQGYQPPTGVTIDVTQADSAEGPICKLLVRNAGPYAVTELQAELAPGSISPPPVPAFDDGVALLRTKQHPPEGWRDGTFNAANGGVGWSPVSASIELGPGAELEFDLHVPARFAPVHCEKVEVRAFTSVPGARAKAEEQTALLLELAEPRLPAPDQVEARLLLRNAGEIHALLNLGAQAGGRYFLSQLSLVAVREGSGEPIALHLAEAPARDAKTAELKLPFPPGASFEQRLTFRAPAPLQRGHYRVTAHFAGEPSLQAAQRSIFPGWVGAVDSAPVALEVP